jgi:hypothetical protein
MTRPSRLRHGITTGLLVLVLAGSAFAESLPRQLDENNLDRHGCYYNVDGNCVHRPAKPLDGVPPPGATAKCRDGTSSFSQHHSGTCSGHGGVAQWQ